ncbi:glycoside hydrolase family 99-like domain-containing protein [Algisphaera agarilytica]|uniref:Glycosyl hydrolase family 71 n=1 Tax=Algisphaera agarilytica TaxID=1385975 RepID=A0A7X0LJU2_9BACT|nr:glycoside hydrolase family 99-like domain-containing protein [Algisphaera agarilytica]MBB6428298.1 hypothetical protein [Algisphaera agarilytica]
MDRPKPTISFTTRDSTEPLALPAVLGHFLPWYTLQGSSFPLAAEDAATITHPPTIENDRHWRDPRAVYRRTHHHMPEIGRYDSRDPETLGWQFGCMVDAGLTGFIINWNGQNSVENTITLAVLEALEAWNQANPDTPLAYCLSIDSQAQLPTEGKTPAPLAEDVAYIKTHLLRSAYLHRDGRPVFTCFPYEDNLPDWLEAFDQQFGSGGYDFLWSNVAKGQGETGCFLWVEPSESSTDYSNAYPWLDPEDSGEGRARERYAQWSDPKHRHLYGMAGVWPGFDDSLVAWAWKPKEQHDRVRPRIIARQNQKGSCYQQLWQSYLDELDRAESLPLPLVQIVTWNDWAEATTIEPARDYGRSLLEETRQYVALARERWKSKCPH